MRAFASAFTRKQKSDRSRPLALYELRAVVTTERSYPSDTDPAYWWKSGSRLPLITGLAARRFRLRGRIADNLRPRRLADLVIAEIQSLDVRQVGASGRGGASEKMK